MIDKRSSVMKTGRVGASVGADRGLQIVLWSLWTLAVLGAAAFNWWLDVSAGEPLNVLGLVIYSTLTGLVGLLVITMVELRLDPERFLD